MTSTVMTLFVKQLLRFGIFLANSGWKLLAYSCLLAILLGDQYIRIAKATGEISLTSMMSLLLLQ